MAAASERCQMRRRYGDVNSGGGDGGKMAVSGTSSSSSSTSSASFSWPSSGGNGSGGGSDGGADGPSRKSWYPLRASQKSSTRSSCRWSCPRATSPRSPGDASTRASSCRCIETYCWRAQGIGGRGGEGALCPRGGVGRRWEVRGGASPGRRPAARCGSTASSSRPRVARAALKVHNRTKRNERSQSKCARGLIRPRRGVGRTCGVGVSPAHLERQAEHLGRLGAEAQEEQQVVVAQALRQKRPEQGGVFRGGGVPAKKGRRAVVRRGGEDGSGGVGQAGQSGVTAHAVRTG